MATEFRPHWGAEASAVITLASLAGAAGRISNQIVNTTAASGSGAEGDEAELLRVWLKITAGTAPALGAPYLLYLIRSDNGTPEHIGEGLGTADAGVSTQPNNSDIILTIPAVATLNYPHTGEIVVPNPGPKFSFLLWNGTAQALNATAGNHYIRYALGAVRQVTV